MDQATYLNNRSKLKSPVVQIDRLSPLADPERPPHVGPADVAGSLFVHLSTTLLGEGRPQAEAWGALTSEARRVRREQQASDRAAMPTQAEDMSAAAIEALVVATTRRDALFAVIDAATPPDDRAEARRRAELAATENAFRGRTEEGVPVWDGGDDAKSYGDAMRALGRVARAEAKVRNVEIRRLNEGAATDELRPLLDPRNVMTGWARSMPATNSLNGARWTDSHIVVMKTNEEAAVMDGFMRIGLKWVDANRTPSRAELSGDVGALRAELATPVVVTKAEQIRRGEAAIADDVRKVGVRAVVVRPAITSRAAEYRRSMSVALGSTAEESADRLRSAKEPIVGIEGQDWYASTDVVTDAMRRMRRAGKYKPTFVSHAGEGTQFRKTLEAAAKAAGIKVVYGRIDIERVNVLAVSGETRTHADGVYASEGRRSRETKTTVTVPDQNATGDGGPDGRRNRIDFDAGSARYQTRGKLVIFDMVPKGDVSEMAVVNARTDHAALTPSRLVAFGVERHTPELWRVLKRRKRSGRSQAFVLSKAGKRVPTAQVNAKVAQIAQSYGEKQRDLVADTHGWKLDKPVGMLLATSAVGAQRAVALAEFPTVGQALAAAERSFADPKNARKVAEDYGVSTAALMAAVQLEVQTRDSVAFQAKAASALARARSVREEDGTSLLVDPRDEMVARQGPMVGFSADKARGAPKGSRVAIVGDEGEVSPALAANVDKLVANLAEKYGRDADGVARMRVMTTLSTGVGEAVMDAAMRHKVPFEAIGHKDDRLFTRGTDDLRLFGKAWKASEEGLGGTWSLNTYGEREPERTMAAAAQVAMLGSDAVVVARVRSRDPLALAVATVGVGKPVATLAPSDPTPAAYDGNVLLATPGATVAVTWETRRGTPVRFTEHAHVSEGRMRDDDGVGRSLASRHLTHATADMGAGATMLNSVDAVGMVRMAAMGELDMRMGRARTDLPDTRIRWDKLDEVDLDRAGERQYMEKLGLRPVEAELVGRRLVEHRLTEVERVFQSSERVSELLSERYRVTSTERAPARRERAGAEIGA